MKQEVQRLSLLLVAAAAIITVGAVPVVIGKPLETWS
jgi:hypothetical protein